MQSNPPLLTGRLSVDCQTARLVRMKPQFSSITQINHSQLEYLFGTTMGGYCTGKAAIQAYVKAFVPGKNKRTLFMGVDPQNTTGGNGQLATRCIVCSCVKEESGADLLQVVPGAVQKTIHHKLVQSVDKVAELVCQHIAMLQGLPGTAPPCLHSDLFQTPLGPPYLQANRSSKPSTLLNCVEQSANDCNMVRHVSVLFCVHFSPFPNSTWLIPPAGQQLAVTTLSHPWTVNIPIHMLTTLTCANAPPCLHPDLPPTPLGPRHVQEIWRLSQCLPSSIPL